LHLVDVLAHDFTQRHRPPPSAIAEGDEESGSASQTPTTSSSVTPHKPVFPTPSHAIRSGRSEDGAHAGEEYEDTPRGCSDILINVNGLVIYYLVLTIDYRCEDKKQSWRVKRQHWYH
jgi:hypothetical protein